MAKTHSFDDAPTSGGNARKWKKVGDLVPLIQLKQATWTGLRLVGPIAIIGGHWVKTKKKDGKPISFYIPCSNFNPETGKRDLDHDCPFCAFEAKYRSENEGDDKAMQNAPSRFAANYLTNVFNIKEVAKAKNPSDLGIGDEEKENGGVPPGAQSDTVARVLSMSDATWRKVRSQKDLNEDDEGEVHSLASLEKGADLNFMHDKEVAPANQWQIQLKQAVRPLTKIEKFLVKSGLWDLEQCIPDVKPEDVQSEFDNWASRNGLTGKKKATEDDDDDEAYAPKKKRNAVADDDEDDEPVKKKKSVSFDDDDDDEPAPKKKSKKAVDDDEDDKPVKSKKSSFDDDDEDDKPAKKSKKKSSFDDEDDEDDAPKSKSKKKSSFDDEDDEDEKPVKSKKKSSFDDDDEDDAPKSKSKKKSSFDDDDEDDKPAKKSKKKVDDDEDDAPKSKSKKKSSFDDDEDDEPAPKKKKKKVDDDDDDIPF